MAATTQVLTFGPGENEAAYATAKRKARYGHRDWLVWMVADGSYRVSQIATETLTQAVKESARIKRGRKTKLVCTMVDRLHGHFYYVSPGLAKIWSANLAAGHYY